MPNSKVTTDTSFGRVGLDKSISRVTGQTLRQDVGLWDYDGVILYDVSTVTYDGYDFIDSPGPNARLITD